MLGAVPGMPSSPPPRSCAGRCIIHDVARPAVGSPGRRAGRPLAARAGGSRSGHGPRRIPRRAPPQISRARAALVAAIQLISLHGISAVIKTAPPAPTAGGRPAHDRIGWRPNRRAAASVAHPPAVMAAAAARRPIRWCFSDRFASLVASVRCPRRARFAAPLAERSDRAKVAAAAPSPSNLNGVHPIRSELPARTGRLWDNGWR